MNLRNVLQFCNFLNYEFFFRNMIYVDEECIKAK